MSNVAIDRKRIITPRINIFFDFSIMPIKTVSPEHIKQITEPTGSNTSEIHAME